MTTRRPHTVWRHYLETWRDENLLVHSSRNGEILPPTNPKKLMVHRDFYKLPQITKTDVTFLEAFIALHSSAALRESHRKLVASCAYISKANELILGSSHTSTAEKDFSQAAVIELEDNWQGQIERNALPLLKELRQKRTDFFNDYEATMHFFRFIAHQYFRTEGMRENIGNSLLPLSPDHEFSRLRNIVCHICAENVASSVFVDRNEFEIVFLEYRNGLGFITADQPVVNLMGTGDNSETTELAFYYPLSPKLACLVTPKTFKLRSVGITRRTVDSLNDLMALESRQFLVANSDQILQHILSKPSLVRPTASCILDALV